MENSHRVEDWLSRVDPKTRGLYRPCWETFTEFCQARGKDTLRLVDDFRKARYQGERHVPGWME